MGKALDLAKKLQEYWLILMFLGGGFMAVMSAVHKYYMVPEVIDPMVRSMAYDLYSDSAEVWRGRMLADSVAGFGGLCKVESNSESKEEAAIKIGKLITEEAGKDITLQYLVDKMTYQTNFNTTVFLMATEPYNYNGIRFRKHIPNPKHEEQFDVYYKDLKGYWWKAIYYADEDGFYYIPIYSNGQRIKCD